MRTAHLGLEKDPSGTGGPGWWDRLQESLDQIDSAAPFCITNPDFSGGAIGDGVTDDLPAIQTAIDTAAAAGGGVVDVPDPPVGWLVSAQIEMKTGVRLHGRGYGSLITKTTLDNDDVINCEGIADFQISQIRVRNSSQLSGDSAFGIRVTNGSTRGWVDHCFVENSWLGIGVLDVAPGTPSSDISICDNFAKDIGNNGIGVNSFGANNRVDRNWISNFGTDSTAATFLGAGIEFRGGIWGRVCGNLITDGTNDAPNEAVDGIRIEYATEGATQQVSDSIFDGNVIRSVSGHGIRVMSAVRNAICNNIIDSAGVGGAGRGIFVLSSEQEEKESTDNTIRGNVIRNSGGDDIILQGEGAYHCRRNDVSHNQCLGSNQYGIRTILADDNMFIGNHIYDADNIGILHTSGDRNTFIGCVVRDCASGGANPGILVQAGDRPRFIDCESFDTRGGGALQTYGIKIDAPVTNPFVIGGLYWPNVTGAIDDVAGANYFQVGVSPAASALGALSRVVKVTDASGNVIGYMPLYDSFT